MEHYPTWAEIGVWSLVAGFALLAMIADAARTRHKKAYRRAAGRIAEMQRRVKSSKGLAASRGKLWWTSHCDLAAANRRLDEAAEDIVHLRARYDAAIKRLEGYPAMKRDLAAARQRARLHCKMIEDQRRRADAAAEEITAKWIRAETAPTDALQHRTVWSACPKCGRLVPCTGYGTPSLIGQCRACGHTVLKANKATSDALDEAKPQNAPTPETTLESLEAIRELWTRAQNLRISLNVGISHDHAENALVWMGKALDKAAKVWPEISKPKAPTMGDQAAAIAGPGFELAWSRAEVDMAQSTLDDLTMILNGMNPNPPPDVVDRLQQASMVIENLRGIIGDKAAPPAEAQFTHETA